MATTSAAGPSSAHPKAEAAMTLSGGEAQRSFLAGAHETIALMKRKRLSKLEELPDAARWKHITDTDLRNKIEASDSALHGLSESLREMSDPGLAGEPGVSEAVENIQAQLATFVAKLDAEKLQAAECIDVEIASLRKQLQRTV